MMNKIKNNSYYKNLTHMEKEKLYKAMTILGVLDDIFGNTRRKFIERQQKNIIYYLGLEYIPPEYKQKLSKLIINR